MSDGGVCKISRVVIRDDRPHRQRWGPLLPAGAEANVRVPIHRFVVPAGCRAIFDRRDPHSYAYARVVDGAGEWITGITEVWIRDPDKQAARRVGQYVNQMFHPDALREDIQSPRRPVAFAGAPIMSSILSTPRRAWTPYPDDRAEARAGTETVTCFTGVRGAWKMDPSKSRIAHAVGWGREV